MQQSGYIKLRKHIALAPLSGNLRSSHQPLIHICHPYNASPLPFNPFNAELIGTLSYPPLNSWGRGLKKPRIFCNVRFVWRHQQDLGLRANNNTRRSCALLMDNTKVMSRSHQGHFKVKLAKNIENTHFLSISSCLVVQSSIRKDLKWHILGRVSFQHTFLGNLEQCWYWEG